jgi:hypothetical protein
MQPARDRILADLTIDEVLKRIDVYGRLAFGGQCVAAMAMIAAPVLFVTATILLVVLWDDNRAEALALGIGGWLAAIAAGLGGAVLAVFCWRWSGDWITEWPGYATGIGIALIGVGVLAWLLTSTPVPVYLSFAAAAGGAFGAGFVVAGNLAGMRVLDETRLQRARPAARRRP